MPRRRGNRNNKNSKKTKQSFKPLDIQWGDNELALPEYAIPVEIASKKPETSPPSDWRKDTNSYPQHQQIYQSESSGTDYDHWRLQHPKNPPPIHPFQPYQVRHSEQPSKQPHDPQKVQDMQGDWRAQPRKQAPTLLPTTDNLGKGNGIYIPPKQQSIKDMNGNWRRQPSNTTYSVSNNNGKDMAPKKKVNELVRDYNGMNGNWRQHGHAISKSSENECKWRSGGLATSVTDNTTDKSNSFLFGMNNDHSCIEKVESGGENKSKLDDISDSGDSIEADHCVECMAVLPQLQVQVTECITCYMDISTKDMTHRICNECGCSDKRDDLSMCHECKDTLYPDDTKEKENENEHQDPEDESDEEEDNTNCKKCNGILQETAILSCCQCNADISYRKQIQTRCSCIFETKKDRLLQLCDTCQILDISNSKWKDNKSIKTRCGEKRKKRNKQKANIMTKKDDRINIVEHEQKENPELRDDLNMMQMMELSRLEEQIQELNKIKLQRQSLYKIKGCINNKIQFQQEQATIMDIMDILRNMKEMNNDYYIQFLKQNTWAGDMMNRSDNMEWDAFN